HPQLNDGHGISAFTEKGADASVPSGATALVRNVLHNSVMHHAAPHRNVPLSEREGGKDAWELCKRPAHNPVTVEQAALESAINANRRSLGIHAGRGRQ